MMGLLMVVMKTVNSMIKILKQLYIPAGLALLLIGLPTSVMAVESLVVDFENVPLFGEANFIPGDEVTRFVGVTNNTDGAKDIIVEAINTSDPDGLGDALILKITEGVTTLYSDTLASFFGAGEVALSELLGGGGDTEYDLTISFKEESENTYQGKSLGFDILIGFLGEGGGGGGGLPPGLSIQDESVRITNIEETSVTIEWSTSYLSTSQVIYGTAVEDHTLDLSDDTGAPPTYGYAHTTAEFDLSPMVTSHSVIVMGLTSETSYFFRAVSHASPPTITREYTFSTLSHVGNEDDGGQTNNQTPGISLVPSSEGGAVARISITGGGQEEEDEAPLTESLNLFAAGLNFFFDSLDMPFLILLLLIIFILFLLFFWKRRKKAEEDRKKNL